MTDFTYHRYGSAVQYNPLNVRCSSGTAGVFRFTEKFHESDNPRFDAILLLGAQLTHDTGNQDVVNSFCWRGFSKKARAISRVFVRKLYVSASIPNWLNLDDDAHPEYDYTGRYSVVSTLDHGVNDMPNLAHDGVLGEFREFSGYSFITLETPANGEYEIDKERNWIHIRDCPLVYEYSWLEATLPLVFYHSSTGYAEPKAAYVFWKLELGVRFQTSRKAKPSFTKGIEVGGTPG